MTFKALTEQIAMREGLTKQVDIAQISEITKHTLTILANVPPALLEHYKIQRRIR